MPGVIESLIGLYNVTDAGAKGNGQTNDTPRIHDAILALPPSGGTVVFPPGNYFLGSNVTFQGRNNVTLWLLAGASFSGPGALPANAGTNRVFDMSFVSGSFPPSGPAGGALAGNYPNPTLVPIGNAQVDPAAAIASSKLGGYPWHNADLAADVARASLFVNGGFEIAQRPGSPWTGNGSFTLDYWRQDATGGGASTISTSQIVSTIGSPGSSAQLVYTHVAGSGYRYTQPFRGVDLVQLRGKSVTFGFQVRGNVGGSVRCVANGTVLGIVTGNYNVGVAEETIFLTVAIPANETSLFVGVELNVASVTVELNDGRAAIGTVLPSYQPMQPGDDMARCLRYYQRWAPGNTPGVLAAGQAFSTTGAIVPLQLQAKMGGVPTLTFSAAADWQVSNAAFTLTALSALAAYGSNTSSNFGVQATASAAVLVAGNGTLLSAANANAWIALEWNP
jgi:hypothetical protein